MSVAFFVRDEDAPVQREPTLPQGTFLRIWRPRERTGLAALHFDPLRVAVGIQDKLGLFEDDRYAELSIHCATARIHRLIVTPRWRRFPFMAPRDLQIGGLWTHVAWRRFGLARSTIAEAHRMFAGAGQRFWYLADTSNAASIALARSAGYRMVGEGRRTRPVGIGLLGQFQLERYSALA